MQPLLVRLFHVMQPLTHPPIPNTAIVPVSENILAPIVVHVLCIASQWVILRLGNHKKWGVAGGLGALGIRFRAT